MPSEDEFDNDGRDPFDPDEIIEQQQRVAKRTDEQSTAVRRFIEARAGAYRRVFGTASVDDIRMVMEDLERFCRGKTTTFHENDRKHALLTGRQEVYLRIQEHLQLTLDALVERYE